MSKATDPFLKLARNLRAPTATPVAAVGHKERAHSKFSASGADRWFNCPGSVELSEGLPDKSNPWSLEGVAAHEVLEALMRIDLSGIDGATIEESKHVLAGKPPEMIQHGGRAANFMLGLHYSTPDSEIMVETRVYLDFIHPEMFGTFDGAVVDHFGTLHVFDYKYGMTPVSPQQNLQMIFYGIGLAYRYKWNFKRVRLWIIQPRIRGYDGPLYWEMSIALLREYVDRYREAVERVEREPDKYVEGSWCHWCKAKAICPLKQEVKFEKAASVFARSPITTEETDDDDEEENFKTEADWRKEARKAKGGRALSTR